MGQQKIECDFSNCTVGTTTPGWSVGSWALTRLHTSTKAKHEVECRLLLDVIIRQCAAIFQLLAREDQALLIRRDTLFVLDLRLHIINGVRGLDVQSDRLACERLH